MVYDILGSVTDPEIPVLTLEDLGVIRDVLVDGDAVEVKITPTYSGCPATDTMAQDIRQTLKRAGFRNIIITFVISPAWTTKWLTKEGRKKLKQYGIAPPMNTSPTTLLEDNQIACPRCSSQQTKVLSHFGSAACKALLQCNECLEPFEYFKCHQ